MQERKPRDRDLLATHPVLRGEWNVQDPGARRSPILPGNNNYAPGPCGKTEVRQPNLTGTRAHRGAPEPPAPPREIARDPGRLHRRTRSASRAFPLTVPCFPVTSLTLASPNIRHPFPETGEEPRRSLAWGWGRTTRARSTWATLHSPRSQDVVGIAPNRTEPNRLPTGNTPRKKDTGLQRIRRNIRTGQNARAKRRN